MFLFHVIKIDDRKDYNAQFNMVNLMSLSSSLFIGLMNLYFNFYLKKATYEVSINYTKFESSKLKDSKLPIYE